MGKKRWLTSREERIQESDEIRPGIIADSGYDGGLVRIEIRQASKNVDKTQEIYVSVS
ncbi:MAG: DUF2283 domain-containing protein [Candidatus Omnitrophica bacterium]|nr:DUF2283 domain-containing protein [Candidatus Omnitrophota bacterium]